MNADAWIMAGLCGIGIALALTSEAPRPVASHVSFPQYSNHGSPWGWIKASVNGEHMWGERLPESVAMAGHDIGGYRHSIMPATVMTDCYEFRRPRPDRIADGIPGPELPVPERISRLNVFKGTRVQWWVPWTSTESDRPTEPPEPRFELPARPER
jgi:hypothetical protein